MSPTPGRRTPVPLVLVGGLAVLAARLAPWAHGRPRVPVAGLGAELTATGADAAPAGTALALVAMAAALALLLAGPRAALPLAGLVAMAGLGVAAVAVATLLDPGDALRSAVRRQSSVTDVDIVGAGAGPGPMLALAGALLLLLGAVVAWRALPTWTATPRRFERGEPPVADGATIAPGPPSGAPGVARTPSGPQAQDAWSAMDRGDDPTGAEHGPPADAPDGPARATDPRGDLPE